MSRVPVGSFLIASLVAQIAAAQAPPNLRVGERIRVAHWCSAAHHGDVDCRNAPAPRVDAGQLQALDADTLRMRTPDGGESLAIPTGLVTQLWVLDGTEGNAGAGAVLGLIGGGLIGAAIGSTQEGDCYWMCGVATAAGGLSGAAAGLLIGGIAGSSIHSDRWRAVSLKGVHVSLAPGPHAMGLAASISF